MIERIGPISRHQRLIGEVTGQRPGPTVVFVGGIHGNEPAGVLALERMLGSLRRRQLGRGRIVALIGNLGALNHGRRYIDLDLNRLWWPRLAETGAANGGSGSQCQEGFEKQQLRQLLSDLVGEQPQEHYLVDLHTTSSPSAPFAIAGCNERCRRFADIFELPVVLGLEEQLGNTLVDYCIDMGWVAAAVEAGQHQDPNSIGVHESLLWQVLEKLNCIDGDLPDRVRQARRRVQESVNRAPRAVRVLYRHPVRPGDGFRMQDGFENLETVTEGQVLARDSGGDIIAPAAGRLLMPLYQSQGEDGFFIVRDA